MSHHLCESFIDVYMQDMQRITWRHYTFLDFHVEKWLKTPKKQTTKHTRTPHQEVAS